MAVGFDLDEVLLEFDTGNFFEVIVIQISVFICVGMSVFVFFVSDSFIFLDMECFGEFVWGEEDFSGQMNLIICVHSSVSSSLVC